MRQLALIILAIFCFHSSAFGAKLESVSVSPTKDTFFVIFKTRGALEYTSTFLSDPPRVVIHLNNTDSELTGKTLEPKENEYLYRIRTTAKLSPGKKDLQVILDLKTTLDYSVVPMTEGFALRLSLRKNNPETHNPAAEKSAIANPASQSSALSSNPDEFLLQIGPEDLLEVTVFELPQFNVTSRVSGDGTITMPLIGSVRVTGMTKEQAEQKLEKELEVRYINNANVSINIKEYKSKQIAVLGAVQKPGPYYILSNRTLLQVITDAGGLAPDVGSKCFVFRPNGTKIEIDLADLMIAGNQKWNIAIQPGDVLNFPPAKKSVVYVLGEVKAPGPIELPFGAELTLLTAIARAGGLTSNAKSEIQLRRKNQMGEIELIKVSLKDVMKGKKPDIHLQADDVINVPESFF